MSSLSPSSAKALFALLLSAIFTTACGGSDGGGSTSSSSAGVTFAAVTPTPTPTLTPTLTPTPAANPTIMKSATTGSNGTTTTTTTSSGTTTATVACTNSGAASQVNLGYSASRVSGVAPLGVFFDATATTATSTSRPFHDLEYRWTFSDPSGGSWTNGTKPGSSKNSAMGPVTAHVFESAGTYTVALAVRDGNDTVTNNCVQVTVTAPEVEWAVGKTYCYSTNTDFTGAPAGCTQVPNVSNIALSILANMGQGNLRHLLHKGQTFALSTQIMIDKGGPSMIGAFGTGANPIINSTLSGMPAISLSRNTTPTGVSDWRFQDLTIDCNNTNNSSGFAGNGSFSDVTISRVYITRCGYGVLLSGSTLNALNASVRYTHAMWDKLFIVDSTIYDLYTSASGPNAVFANASRVAMLGNKIDNNGHGEHGIRFQYANRAVFSNNTIQGIAPGKVNLTVRGAPYGGDNTLAGPGVYSEKIVISDNKMIGGASVGMVGFGPQNGTSDERGQNILFERNLLLASTSVQNTMLVSQPDVTIRNNMVNIPAGAGGGFAFGVQPSGVVPNPTRVHVYNNTVYHGGSAANRWALLYVSINNDASPYDQTMPGSVFEAKNNILYAPNKPATWYTMVYQDTAARSTTTSTNNTPDVSNTASPLFANTPPVAIADFTPSAASYANGTGTASVKVWSDFYGTDTQATPDMGAVVH